MESEVAWIDDGPRRLVARAPKRDDRIGADNRVGADGRAASPAESAVTRLIQGIYEREPLQARRILRLRIHTTAPRATEMCWGMVRVAAKRLECGARWEDVPAPREVVELGGDFASADPRVFGMGDPREGDGPLREAPPMAVAVALAQRVCLHPQRSRSDRPIAAVLVDKTGKILAWAVNSSSANKTLHAEVQLVQGYCREAKGPLPVGARIHTTLKCCKMCAGMIWSAAQDPLTLQVFFAEDDPGPKARRTVLTPGSFERERARPGSRELLELQAASDLHKLSV